MKKILTILITIVLLFSFSGCCLSISFAILAKKYGPMLYFADFWSTFGSKEASTLASSSEIDLTKTNIDPLLKTITFKGTHSFVEEDTVGKFANYAGPIDYIIVYKMVEPFNMQNSMKGATFESMKITGTIAISKHNRSYVNIIGRSKNIIFKGVGVKEGAVIDGIVKVDLSQLDLANYSKLISEVQGR